MSKKLLLCLSCFVLLSSCGNGNQSSSVNKESSSMVGSSSEIVESTYQIKVVDIDGEVLGENEIDLNEQTNVFNDLVANFNVNYTVDNYGPYISSINGSIVDANYYMAIYENNEKPTIIECILFCIYVILLTFYVLI